MDEETEVDEKHNCPSKPTLISDPAALPFAPCSLDSRMVAYPKERIAVIVII